MSNFIANNTLHIFVMNVVLKVSINSGIRRWDIVRIGALPLKCIWVWVRKIPPTSSVIIIQDQTRHMWQSPQMWNRKKTDSLLKSCSAGTQTPYWDIEQVNILCSNFALTKFLALFRIKKKHTAWLASRQKKNVSRYSPSLAHWWRVVLVGFPKGKATKKNSISKNCLDQKQKMLPLFSYYFEELLLCIFLRNFVLIFSKYAFCSIIHSEPFLQFFCYGSDILTKEIFFSFSLKIQIWIALIALPFKGPADTTPFTPLPKILWK